MNFKLRPWYRMHKTCVIICCRLDSDKKWIMNMQSICQFNAYVCWNVFLELFYACEGDIFSWGKVRPSQGYHRNFIIAVISSLCYNSFIAVKKWTYLKNKNKNLKLKALCWIHPILVLLNRHFLIFTAQSTYKFSSREFDPVFKFKFQPKKFIKNCEYNYYID